MKKTLLLLTAVSIATGAYSQIADGQYIISTEEGTYLNSGHSWGTAAVVSPLPRVFEVTNNGDFCNVKSSIGYWKGGTEIFIDGGEGDKANFEFEKSGDVYLIKHDGKYFAKNELIDFKDGDWWNWEKACHQDIQWTIKLVDSADEAQKWNIVTLEDAIANLKNATAENPMNATFFIKANNMSRNDSDNLTAWEFVKNGDNANFITPDPNWIYGDNDSWAHQDTYGFVQNDNPATDNRDVVMQNVEGLPAGDYDVVYRVTNQNNTPLELNINGSVLPVADFTESDLWYNSAMNALKNGEKSGSFKVAADGKLSIKMIKESKVEQQNRFAFKTFRIFYKGDNFNVVNNIEVENLPVEYYNLQGVRVANPGKGIYIMRQGEKATKVIR